jgi:hypothetical protein
MTDAFDVACEGVEDLRGDDSGFMAARKDGRA